MRKVTSEAVHAFYNRTNYKSGNTQVRVDKDDDSAVLLLHGNAIATIDAAHRVFITLAGWNSPTTRERLNGLNHVRVNTKQGQAYLNGEKWSGGWQII